MRNECGCLVETILKLFGNIQQPNAHKNKQTRHPSTLRLLFLSLWIQLKSLCLKLTKKNHQAKSNNCGA